MPKHKKCEDQRTKIKGALTEINQICPMFKQDTQQCDHDSFPITSACEDLHRLDSSFLYTQIHCKKRCFTRPKDVLEVF